MLERLKSEGRREASALQDQIELIEHCAALIRGKLNKMPAPEFATHLDRISESGVFLPYDLRCQVLSRRCNDLLGDVDQAGKNEDWEKAGRSWARAVAVWAEVEGGTNDTQLESNAVWAAAKASIKLKGMKGTLSAGEVEDELKTAAEARGSKDVGASSSIPTARA